jgi:hypothetical protein
MRLLKRALILAGCVMLLAVLWGTFFLDPVKPSPQSLTRYLLEQSYEGLRILAVYRPRDYGKLLQQEANLEMEVAARLREVSDLNALHLDTDDRNRPLDGWGNPLNIRRWQDVRERMSKLDGIPWQTNFIVI